MPQQEQRKSRTYTPQGADGGVEPKRPFGPACLHFSVGKNQKQKVTKNQIPVQGFAKARAGQPGLGRLLLGFGLLLGLPMASQ